MSKKLKAFLVAGAIVALFGPHAIGQPLATPHGAARITQAEFKKLRAANNVIVVDTRGVDGFQRGHIPGAIVLPLEGLNTFAAEYTRVIDGLKTVKKPIVTYCA